MNSPEGRIAMRGNFWGMLGEHYARAYGRLGDGEILSGIPGSPTDHHTRPLRDDRGVHRGLSHAFAAARTRSPSAASRTTASSSPASFMAVAGGAVRDLYAKVPFDDVLYSLATSNPGALVLHNLSQRPAQAAREADAHLPATSPRPTCCATASAACRATARSAAMLGMRVPKSFEELTANPDWQRELARDLRRGREGRPAGRHCDCETAPPGFGFSDTAFRIFILMASRRLKSDRFFTADFTPEVYTPAGFAWIHDNNMRTVLERHLPHMRPHFANVRNVVLPLGQVRGRR